MKIIFLTNFFIHQESFASAMYELSGGDFLYVETGEMSEERSNQRCL